MERHSEHCHGLSRHTRQSLASTQASDVVSIRQSSQEVFSTRQAVQDLLSSQVVAVGISPNKLSHSGIPVGRNRGEGNIIFDFTLDIVSLHNFHTDHTATVVHTGAFIQLKHSGVFVIQFVRKSLHAEQEVERLPIQVSY